MKKKFVSLLLSIAVVGTFITGCAQTTAKDGVAYSYTTQVQEPTITEGYFKDNNIVVEGAGVEGKNTLKKFTYLSCLDTETESKIVEYTGSVGISEKVDGDKKTVTITVFPQEEIKDETKGEVYFSGYLYGFVDQYTGVCYLENKELNPTTTIKADGKEYEISISYPKDNVIEISCPKEYEGAALFVSGTNATLLEENMKNMDQFISISEITHGDYDMKFFAR